MSNENTSRLGMVMAALGLSAVELAAGAGISNSLVSRWQRGVRPLPAKGHTVRDVAAALARLDAEGKLDGLIAPYNDGSGKEQALQTYLSGGDMPGLPPHAASAPAQYSGEYVASQRVLLGARGFRKASLLMLDYLALLPPGQSLTVCAHGGFDLWHGSLPFALRFLQKLPGLMKRSARMTLITRNAEGFDGSHYFSVFWLVLQLRGVIRIRYYDGAAPDEYFVANIQGYWSGRVERDDTAEDGLVSTLYSDARNIRRDEGHCAAFVERSMPAGQFGFLRKPKGGAQQAWRPGPLPGWNTPNAAQPDGSFCAICRTPSFGIMTHAEWATLCGGDAPPALPDHLFCGEEGFAPGPHSIILCREDVREGLANPERLNEPLSELLGRSVYVPRDMLAAQLGRLLSAMDENPDFHVALTPKSAFEKLELELVYWKDSIALGWMQDGSESLMTADAPTCVGFANAAAHVWRRLHKGWARKKTMKATLRKWLAGEGLDDIEPDSASVRNWEVLPRDRNG